MSERAWLHHTALCTLASPVDVIARGPKRSHVRLRHKLRWNRRFYPAGSTRYVPTSCLASKPARRAMVSAGNCVYVQQNSVRGERVVARG